MVTYRKQYREHNVLQELVKWFVDLVFVVALAYMISTGFFEKNTVVGHSMEGALCNGDVVLVDRLTYRVTEPKRYDVVIFENDIVMNDIQYYIKRIVGLPGETIQIKDGYIFIDGSQLKDDVVDTRIYNPGIAADEITLRDNEYFVIGDNRNNSQDSRMEEFGIVNRDDIDGKTWLICSPVSRVGFVK